ncbi:MAG TPA: sugar phosphate isomerase/epimerase family protein [Nitrososphaerales archaeon]|nr:sugar phosphate isomerase/epimerase family protein [Nitrososphaerales archaeon]
MPEWKYAFIPYYSNTPQEAIDVLSRYGYKGVEWIAYLHFRTRDELKSLADLTRKNGLEVANIMCSSDLVVPDDTKRAERVKYTVEKIEDARSASIDKVNLFSGPAEWDPSAQKIGRDFHEGAAWKNLIESFTAIVASAEKNDITITFEAAFGMLVHDFYTLQEFLSYFGSKNLAVNMDPSHMVLYGNDVEYAVRRLGKRIKHVHMKDAVGKPGSQNDTFTFPMLGEGVTDWKGFFNALSDVGYDGYLSVEFEAENYLRNIWGGDWTKSAEASKDQLDKITHLE